MADGLGQQAPGLVVPPQGKGTVGQGMDHCAIGEYLAGRQAWQYRQAQRVTRLHLIAAHQYQAAHLVTLRRLVQALRQRQRLGMPASQNQCPGLRQPHLGITRQPGLG
ncbi:hypothetical protein D3C85_1003540 [compost metagenome]